MEVSTAMNDSECVISYVVLAGIGQEFALVNNPDHQRLSTMLSGEWKVRDIICTPTGAGAGMGAVVVTVFLVKSDNVAGYDYGRKK
jgi:hypothetical protein